MTQRFKRLFPVLYPLGHALVLASFFFRTFNYHMEVLDLEGNPMTVRVPVTGIEALTSGHFFIFGNILIWGVFLASVVLLILWATDCVAPRMRGANAPYHVMVSTIQIGFAILVATLLGTYLELLGMAVIGLVVGLAMMRHALSPKET
jgi:hypothetical protein